MKSHTVSNVHVYPYYPGVATETAPVLFNGQGSFVSRQTMGQQAHQLSLAAAEIAGTVQVGAAYSWLGYDAEGDFRIEG